MEQEINMDKPEADDRKQRLEKTKKLLFEEEFTDFRNQLENSQKFEREIMIQNFTEKDLLFEKKFRETDDLIAMLSQRIESVEAEIKHLKQDKIDIQKLAIVLSDLSLQLMNIANNEKD